MLKENLEEVEEKKEKVYLKLFLEEPITARMSHPDILTIRSSTMKEQRK